MTDVAPTPNSDSYSPDPRRWKALAVCFAAGFITMLDVSIVNVALPSIQTALQAGPTQLQMVVAGYSLAFGLVLVPFGRLGDARGRRRMFMLAMAGFGITSLLAGLSQTDTQLAIFRLLQGAFAGMSNPQVSGMIQQLFRGKERGKAFGFFGAVIGVSTAIGPLIGGVILALAGPTVGWRWVFFINVPICLVVVILAGRLLPAPPPRAEQTKLDLLGLILIGCGTATFMAPFVTTPDTGFFNSPGRWFWLIPAAVLLPITFYWERHYQHKHHAAVANPALLRDRSFIFGTALGAAYFGGNTALMLVMSMMLQTGLGYSALLTGLVQLPYAVASGLSSSQAGKMVANWGRRLVVIGLAITLVGFLVIDTVLRYSSGAAIAWALGATLFFMGLGNGSVISPNQTLTFQDVPPKYGSVAGALLQVGQRTGSSIGMAIILAVFLSGFATRLPHLGNVEAARQAASTSLLVSACFIALALVVALLDMRRRTH